MSTENEESKILYKYRNWNNNFHKKIIFEREIYFPSIKDFNDPFDSDIRYNYEELSKDKQIEIISRHIDKNFPNLDSFKKRQKIKELYELSAFNNPSMFKKNFENYLKPLIEKEYGVFSLSRNKDSILMWSHYANNYTGFCVGFHRDKLKNELIKYDNSKSFCRLEKVEYFKNYPIINPEELDDIKYVLKLFLVKSINWFYEDEERIIYRFPSNRKVTLSEECYSEIIFGCKMETSLVDGISERISQMYPKIKIYKAEKSDRKFSLKFIKISTM